jgi:ubiquinone/menaquinone biosynthesis C-methylase UbiE
VLKEVSRVLAPGGRFYLVDFTVNRGKESPVFSIAADSIKFYSPYQREVMGSSAGLLCMNHYYLLGPVLLTVFAKPT